MYSGSKGAVEAFVRCLAVDMGDRKITVNAVAPGGIKTDMAAEAGRMYLPEDRRDMSDEDLDKFVAGLSPLDRCKHTYLGLCVNSISCMLTRTFQGAFPMMWLVSSPSLLPTTRAGLLDRPSRLAVELQREVSVGQKCSTPVSTVFGYWRNNNFYTLWFSYTSLSL